MAAGALFFSAMSALVKLAGAHIPVMEIVLARSLVVGFIASVSLAHDRVPLADLLGKERGLLVLRGLLGFAALTCVYEAVVRLPLADATVIQFTSPVFTAVIAAAVLGERLGWKEYALVTLGLGGVVLVARPTALFGAGAALDPVGVGIATAGAVLSAGAYVSVRRLRAERPMVIVLWFAVISALLSGPLVMRDPVWPDWRGAGVLFGVGVTTYLGQISITWGLRLERAGRALSVGYLQILFAATWGWLLFSEVPDLWVAAGAGIILGSTILMVRIHPVQ